MPPNTNHDQKNFPALFPAFLLPYLLAHLQNVMLPGDDRFIKPVGLREEHRNEWPRYIDQADWESVMNDPNADANRVDTIIANMVCSTRTATMSIMAELPSGGRRKNGIVTKAIYGLIRHGDGVKAINAVRE